jgi:hypothetical protein
MARHQQGWQHLYSLGKPGRDHRDWTDKNKDTMA